MSEKRLNRVDQRFDAVDRRFDSVDRRLDAVDQRFDSVDRRLDAVDQRFDSVDRRFDEVDKQFDALKHEMRLLHEDVIGRLAALPEQSLPTRSEMLDAFAHLEERLGRDIDPLKAVARNHEERIARLERKR